MIAMSQYMFHILISNVKILILALSIPAFVFCLFISIEVFTNRAGLPPGLILPGTCFVFDLMKAMISDIFPGDTQQMTF